MKYIFVNGQKIPVSREIYSSCKKIQNRSEYLQRLDMKNRLINISAYDSEQFNALENIKDSRPLADEILIEREMKNNLYKILNKLDFEEITLIYELFFKNRSLSYVARKEGVSATNIKRRKERILQKLRKLLSSDEFRQFI